MEILELGGGGAGAMRDAHDMTTRELEGIEPPPPGPPPRLPIAQRRAGCGYVGPREAKSCRNCRHRVARYHSRDPSVESCSWRCTKHDFPVELGAVCADHGPALRCVVAQQGAN